MWSGNLSPWTQQPESSRVNRRTRASAMLGACVVGKLPGFLCAWRLAPQGDFLAWSHADTDHRSSVLLQQGRQGSEQTAGEWSLDGTRRLTALTALPSFLRLREQLCCGQSRASAWRLQEIVCLLIIPSRGAPSPQSGILPRVKVPSWCTAPWLVSPHVRPTEAEVQVRAAEPARETECARCPHVAL